MVELINEKYKYSNIAEGKCGIVEYSYILTSIRMSDIILESFIRCSFRKQNKWK